jgi:hypothetical protein
MNQNQSRCHFFTHACNYTNYYNLILEVVEYLQLNRCFWAGASFNQEHNNPFSPRANSEQMFPPIQKGKNLRSILKHNQSRVHTN